jgi:hypothetical protein
MEVLSTTLDSNKAKGSIEMDDTFFKKSNKGLKGVKI